MPTPYPGPHFALQRVRRAFLCVRRRLDRVRSGGPAARLPRRAGGPAAPPAEAQVRRRLSGMPAGRRANRRHEAADRLPAGVRLYRRSTGESCDRHTEHLWCQIL